MAAPKRIIILGDQGFIGGHLKRSLEKNYPGIDVIGRDLPDADLKDAASVMRMADLFGPDTTVVHLAAIKRQFGDTLDVFEQNMRMTTNLCALFKDRPVGCFLFFSSAAVYGEDIHNTHITEETPVCPTSYYGMVKFISERLFWKTFASLPGSRLTIVRPPTIYGSGDQGGTYGPVKFIAAAVKKEKITLWGNGGELREFMFVGDIVEIVGRLIVGGHDGILNLASGVSYTFRDILNTLEDITGSKMETDTRPRSKDKVDNAFVNEKLKKMIGPYSFTDLPTGVRTLYDHFCEEKKKESYERSILQA